LEHHGQDGMHRTHSFMRLIGCNPELDLDS
jgi:hypothetical protein